MKKSLFITVIIFVFTFSSLVTNAQFDNSEIISPVHLEGPRVGFTVISGKLADKLKDDFDINPFITQFGWQFETRFFSLENGTSGLVEGIALIGGMEQSKLLPSGSFLVGLRNAQGIEFGFGPNLSLSGIAYVFAFGYTASSKYINFPINFAIVPSKDGVRFSILAGFNARRK